MIILTFFAFLSGIVTILSPCILPVLPLVLTGSVGGKRKPLGVMLGFIVSFSIFTLVLSTLVQLFNLPPDILRFIAVVLIIVLGFVLFLPKLQYYFELAVSRLIPANQNANRTGFWGGIVTGTSLGLIWTPCVGPIMASVISLAISQQIDGGSVVIIMAYSLGTAIPMVAVMLGGRSLINKFPKLKTNSGKIQKVFGMVMILTGFSIAFGLDRQFQTQILRVFPNYGTGLTALENIEPVQKALYVRSAGSNEKKELTWQNPPHDGQLADYGMAPEIVTNGEYLNTAPLSMEGLRGKVVLVDFWTYSCINCVRTIPHLQDWYKKYHQYGLEIIGIHTPEFAFERSIKNLEKAVKELGVTWPVVQDNNFWMWKKYNNRYWPAHYFIDASGTIRYYHFGEGKYDVSERVIRELLIDADANLPDVKLIKRKRESESRTPETYLGYGRATGFFSAGKLLREEATEYNFIGDWNGPTNGRWDIQGLWTIRKDFIESQNSGKLKFGFNAKNVFLVIELLEEDAGIAVNLDNKKGPDTIDVKDGEIQLDTSRLYQLIGLKKPGKHIVELAVSGKVRLFAFTFG